MLVFLTSNGVAESARSAATSRFRALLEAKNPAHKQWKLLKNHSKVGGCDYSTRNFPFPMKTLLPSKV
jgi:hypothetical protein